ncbi:cytidylyltransferase domain-containing protein [Microbacterium sp. 22242]|uniref:cytidylyltransferase domain-containing protein n=1 Tax=Microbacterium sp. 22242 TaxID=3453896 RepID=UPI003F8312AC
MTRVGIVTQARTTSSRLPGKVLLEAAGRTMLAHHLERLGGIGAPVIVATTVNRTDDPIVDIARAGGALVFRGSEHDVLGRFAGAADASALDVVVRVTSDCPLIDPALVRHGIDLFLGTDDPHAYVSNTLERSYPRGFDFEVFSAEALRAADVDATGDPDREHVTPFIRRSPDTHLHSVVRTPDASRHRVTLDTADDYALLRRLIEEHDAARLDADALIRILDAHPELTALNAHVEQKKLGD